jgi:hypothetical protein
MTTKQDDAAPELSIPAQNDEAHDGETQSPAGTGWNPSVKTRFPKGYCGNPSGRPKGARNKSTIVEAVLNEKVTIRDGKRTRKISKFEIMVTQMMNEAAKGSAKAQANVLQLVKTFGLVDKLPAPDVTKPLTTDDQALIDDFLVRHSTKPESKK